MRTWKDSMDRLKAVLFDVVAVEATLTRDSETSTRKVIVCLLDNRKLTDSSVVSRGQVDLIVEADYKPRRGDLFTIDNKKYRVKERDNQLYRTCDNVNSLIRVYVQKET